MKFVKFFIGILVLMAICAPAWYWFSDDLPLQGRASSPFLKEKPQPEIDSLLEISSTEMKARNIAQARDYAEQALLLSRHRGYHTGEVRALNRMGNALGQIARYDSSIAILQKAWRMGEQYSIDPLARAETARHLGHSYLWLGEYDQAQRYLQRGLAYYREAEDTLGISAMYNHLGLVHSVQSEFDKAAQIWEEGLKYAVKVPDDRYFERSMIGNLGYLYLKTGQLDKAAPRIERSLQMGREMEDRRAQSIDLSNLGDIEFIRGNLREATRLYLESARLKEEIGANRVLIDSYYGIALCYDAMNDFHNAEYYYQKGIDVIENRLAGKFQPHSHLYQGFAKHWLRRGEYAKARRYIGKAIEGFEALKNRADLVMGYLTLGELYLKEKKYTDAIGIIQSALDLAREINSLHLASVYLQLGEGYYELREKDSALANLELAIRTSRDLNETEIAWQAHHYLSRLHYSNGRIRRAIHHSRQAIDLIEQLRGYTLSPASGSAFLADKTSVYQHYFDILFRQYQEHHEKEIVENLFALSAQTRSRALLDNLKSGMKTFFSQQKESADLQNLEAQMVAINRLIREELLKPKKIQRNELIRSWRQQLASLQRQYDLHTTRFAASSPEFSAMLGVNHTTSIAQLQGLLNPDAAFISYYVSSEEVFAFVITPNGVQVKNLPISVNALWQEITALRKPFQDFKDGRIDFLRLSFDAKLSQSLYRRLIAPLLPDLNGITNLVIVPDGALNYLPFEMLIAGREAAGQSDILFGEYAQYRFMIEDFTISYLPSTALYPFLSRGKSIEAQGALLAFGNPIPSEQLTDPQSRSEMPQLAVNAPPAGLRLMAMTPLPGASLEVQGISNFFDSKEVLGLTGDAASETLYKERAGRFRYIHFATHGYVDEQNPNFSALLLNPGSKEEDGFLYTHEIYAHPLHAELVSLSACETGLGKLQQGEGLISFVQAFFAAGAQNVMASLWSVEESTYPLMISFYKFLREGNGKAEALRRAKLEFIDKQSSYKGGATYTNRHPFLWAPFVLYGVD